MVAVTLGLGYNLRGDRWIHVALMQHAAREEVEWSLARWEGALMAWCLL